ncbi:hypothetical protein TUM4261_40460 [Shewanella sp. c952]|nr:hypothetical protein TUM4261_40460 [Shewanella sp. c952]
MNIYDECFYLFALFAYRMTRCGKVNNNCEFRQDIRSHDKCRSNLIPAILASNSLAIISAIFTAIAKAKVANG